jgi:hypothetical protein
MSVLKALIDVVAVVVGVGVAVVLVVAGGVGVACDVEPVAAPGVRHRAGEARRRSTTFSKALGEWSASKAWISSGLGGGR